ncbi:glycosyltransferase family 4 protein [Candidatus Microthrix parvicella]|jgi:glycosyltransferase involved in cell wall biosynthesis|uniref:glycosyltransferase family 4 protein n=2 Tax=Candidatus Neomicrothrix TaxID=41949 RepID=UPI000368C746|nr:glycosyltransferase family 4 protein [Candidatus Microthrix parvicella]
MRTLPGPGDPLSIAYLTYRGKPHVGGQGVYTRHLTKALADLGHHVEVLSGQPYPTLDERVPLIKLPSLDIYNDHFPMRMPGLWELKDFADWAEVTSFSAGTFPEPLAFSIRAARWLAQHGDRFDLVHDNQSLGYGLLAIERQGLPVLGTIHHPITVDRRVEMEHAEDWKARWGKRRWYRFTRMQTRVAKRLSRIITVSENSATDILADHDVSPDRLHIVPVGVDPNLFRPLTGVERVPRRIISTASADVPMKGQRFLLEAVAKLRAERPDVTLTIIGSLKDGSRTHSTLDRLGLRDCVTFVSGVSDERIVELYSEASVAVVPSLYEGFSLPAIEAMAAACPLVATTGGALPEVTGVDGDTCYQVPPGDADALVAGINRVFDHPAEATAVGERGRNRVVENWSWKRTAERTVTHYRALLADAAADTSTNRTATIGKRHHADR